MNMLKMATEYCSTKYLMSAAEVSEAMCGNQPISMQSLLAFCQRHILSETKSTIVIFLPYPSVQYIGISLPLGNH